MIEESQTKSGPTDFERLNKIHDRKKYENMKLLQRCYKVILLFKTIPAAKGAPKSFKNASKNFQNFACKKWRKFTKAIYVVCRMIKKFKCGKKEILFDTKVGFYVETTVHSVNKHVFFKTKEKRHNSCRLLYVQNRKFDTKSSMVCSISIVLKLNLC